MKASIMNRRIAALIFSAKSIFLSCALLPVVAASQWLIPNIPLSVQASAKPMIMLAFGRDHRLYYEAYNDASDIDSDGAIDIRFKPSITYLGLFDSDVCYTHDGASNTVTNTANKFKPASAATGLLKTCVNQWSGNWLNYVTTSRIDALRVVLYGGMRTTDTSSETVLSRAYIPQDAHSWSKEYTSLAVDGYRISDYTPLAQPTGANRRHFFGNTTPTDGVNCNPLSNCSGRTPWLSVIENSNLRVWEWASTERPVLNGNAGGTRSNFPVRVEVCTASFNKGCKLYPSGNYKPVGVLHQFGETDQALFGMFSGSYDSHLSGGRLRKVVSSFNNEVITTTGVFNASTTGIVTNMNNFRVFGFNRGRTDNIYEGAVVGNRVLNQGEFPDWGNPVAEMMYEATRYLANKGVPTPAYINNSSNTAINTIDDLMGLSRPAWDRPYAGQGTSTANAPYCARANLLTISDTNISFDSDQLPGVNTNFGSGITTDLTGRHIVTGVNSSLNVKAVADFISANEPSVAGLRFIGQNDATVNTAPSATTIGSLGNVRGLAPEEPTKRGSYYAASVAHYAKVNDLNGGLPGDQTVNNLFVAMASPLLRIEVKLPDNKAIALLPFAKSVGGAFGITPNKANYQPTNQIVDFYVESIANSGPSDINTSTNGGRYEAVFRINYEDVEQGNDHDMDAIVVYTVRLKADNTLEVVVQPIYQAGGVRHRMGYIVSGTTKDGVYLVVQDENDSASYYLNVPPGRDPGYCDVTTPPADCNRLPFLGANGGTVPSTAISTVTFTASSAPAASFLKDPMFYAAKWGGFEDENGNGRPDRNSEWNFDNDSLSLPDSYFLVQNPTKLRDSIVQALTKIIERQGSASNLAANVSSRLDTSSRVYRASYIAGKWSGEVESLPVSATGVSLSSSWRASEQIPSWSSRNLYLQTTDNSVISMKDTSFGTLPPNDRALISSADVYEYLKGNKGKEVRSGGTFRNRDSLLGDIVHSSPQYDLDSDTLYIGSNGGFLHSFNGLTGVEKFGFMPKAVLPRVKNISQPSFERFHEYFVDGENLLGFKFAETSNTYYLYTMLGRGGKGLFSINPGLSTTVPTLLWDYSAPITTTTSTVTATLSAAELDPDLGLMLSSGFSSLTNKNSPTASYAVFAGNGYNSTSGKAVLYAFIIDLNGGLDTVIKIDTGIGGDNGLAGPSGYDINADGKVDFVYAGDLKGNVWKFDVRDTNPANWKLAYTGNTPMFKATDATGKPQPITSVMNVIYNQSFDPGFGQDRLFLTFGTGSYFKFGDTTDLSVQSWYGIYDDQVDFVSSSTPITSTVATRPELTQRHLSSPVGTTAGFTVRYAGADVTNDMDGKRGWFIDFVNPANGERMITKNLFLPGAIKPALQGTSFYPITNDVCVPGGNSYLNALDPFRGINLEAHILLSLPVGSNPGGPIGPIATNPSPLLGPQHTNLHPSSQALKIGIATTPLNLATGGSASTADPWLQNVGITNYGSVNFPTRASDFRRWNERVAVKKTGSPSKDCAGNLISVISGSEGIEASGIAGCEANRIQGRISWREILKD